VYVAAILVIFHYIWVQKADITQPLIWGAILGLLLVFRIPVVRRQVVKLRSRLTRKQNKPATTQSAKAPSTRTLDV